MPWANENFNWLIKFFPVWPVWGELIYRTGIEMEIEKSTAERMEAGMEAEEDVENRTIGML